MKPFLMEIEKFINEVRIIVGTEMLKLIWELEIRQVLFCGNKCKWQADRQIDRQIDHCGERNMQVRVTSSYGLGDSQ